MTMTVKSALAKPEDAFWSLSEILNLDWLASNKAKTEDERTALRSKKARLLAADVEAYAEFSVAFTASRAGRFEEAA